MTFSECDGVKSGTPKIVDLGYIRKTDQSLEASRHQFHDSFLGHCGFFSCRETIRTKVT